MTEKPRGIVAWINSHIAPRITALGLSRGSVTLEVIGRASGKPIRLSVTQVRRDGRTYLVALGGESNWVKNIRAAGGRATRIAGRRTPIQLVEVPVEERAPILLAYVNQRAFTHSGGQSARHFFGLSAKPSLADMAGVAERYPVFEVQPAEQIPS